MTIWFDMDGTLNLFYDVPNWLPKLRSYDPSPYAEAKPMWNMSLLARYINKLRAKGYKFGIISWLAMDSTAEFDKAVTVEKHGWLHGRLRSVTFDAIYITAYGVPKHSLRTSDDDIIFDDNSDIRQAWGPKAYPPSEIFRILKELMDEE